MAQRFLLWMWNALKKFDFTAVTGHDAICAKLRHSVKAQQMVNAYLFAGPDGIGKKTVANAFASALLCENPREGNPCMQCGSCRLFSADSHPDLIRLQTPGDRKTIGVELVREQVIKEAYVRPFSAKRKVFIIENGELMTDEAQNALLKVLEEPPAYTIFLVLATAKGQLLETICSRCVKMELLPLPTAQCDAFFQEQPHHDTERKKLAGSLAQGNIGRGLRILKDDNYYSLYKETIENVSMFFKHPNAITNIQMFFAEKRDYIDYVIDFMLFFLRDSLRFAMNEHAPLICTDSHSIIADCSHILTSKHSIAIMEAAIHFRDRLQKNAGFTIAGLEFLTRIQEEIYDESNRRSF